MNGMISTPPSGSDCDALIVTVYAKQPHTADEIVVNPVLYEPFWSEVNSSLHSSQHFSVADGNKRLLNLRRRGEENGGLPRKRRDYRGRGNTKPKPK